MAISDPSGSTPIPEASASEPARMDVQTTQQMVREMTALTSAMFSLLQPHRAPMPATTTPQQAPSAPLPAIPLPPVPLPPAPAPAPAASIPLPSVPVTDAPSTEAEAEPEPQEADQDDQPTKDSGHSMALLNELAFLDE